MPTTICKHTVTSPRKLGRALQLKIQHGPTPWTSPRNKSSSDPKSMPLQTKASHQSITKRLSSPNDWLYPNTQRENLVHTEATEQQSVLWWLKTKTSDQRLAHTHQNKCPTNLRHQLAFHHRTIHGPSHLTNVSVPNLQGQTQIVEIEDTYKQKLGQLKIPLCGRLPYKEGG